MNCMRILLLKGRQLERLFIQMVLLLFEFVINIRRKIIMLIPKIIAPTILTPIPENPLITFKPTKCVTIPKFTRINGEIYSFFLFLITQNIPQILSKEITIGK